MRSMNVQDLESRYGSMSQAAKALATSRQNVHRWKVSGIPVEWQLKIELLTNGALRADIDEKIRNADQSQPETA